MSFITTKNQQFLLDSYAQSKSRQAIPADLYQRYEVKRGLRNDNGTGVLVGLTDIGEVYSYIMDDGERLPVEGRLFYHGYSVTDLVNGFYSKKEFGFEEAAYLLLYGDLPTADKLETFNKALAEARALPHNFIEDHIFRSPSKDIMNKIARSVLGLYAHDEDPDNISPEYVLMQGISLIARFPSLAAYSYMAKRHYIDHDSLYIHAPLPEYNSAENLLHMIRPDGTFTELEARTLDLALVLHAEHGGGNNSTFTCRAVSSTGTDTYSAIAAAMGSLKGPQHGGASGKAFAMMQDLKKEVKNWRSEMEIADYLGKVLRKEAFDRSGLVYGMGHAVYTLSDPRTKLLRDYARALAYECGREDEYLLYTTTERMGPETFRNVKKSDKVVCANVDFYSGFVYDMLGIPEELFTPIFAVARVTGWMAHRLEELISGGRIIRPAYKTVQKRRQYLAMEERE